MEERIPAEPVSLNRKTLETLLAALDEALERQGASAEVYVAGGARMILGFKDDRTTTDVDVVFRRSEGQGSTAQQRNACGRSD